MTTATAPPQPPATVEVPSAPEDGGSVGSPLRAAAVTALVAALASAWLFHHLLAHPGSARVAGNPNDTTLYCWWLQHGASSFLHGPRAFLVASSLNAPFGLNAMWNTSMLFPSVVLAPVTELAGPLASYNLLLIASPPLTAFVAHILLRRFVARDAAARTGALFWAFCPAALASDIGHACLAFNALLPCILLAAHEAGTGRRPRRAGLLFGLACAAQLLTGEELLFQTGIVLVVVVVVLGLTRPIAVNLDWARRTAPAGAVAAIAFLVVAAYPLWVQFAGPLTEHGSPFLTQYYVADATGFFTPSARMVLSTSGQSRFAAMFTGGAPEYMFYIGYPMAAIALATGYRLRHLWTARVLGVIVIVAGLASLGSELLINGVRPGVHLPYHLLGSFPVIEDALPDRFSIVVDLALAGLVALAVERLALPGRVATRAVGWTLVGAAALSWLPHAFDSERVAPAPKFFSSSLPADVLHRTVLLLPYPGPSRADAMLWQAAAHDSFNAIGGYFIGPAAGGQAFVSGPGPLPTAKLLDGVAATGQVPVVDATAVAQFNADALTWGARTVVLGPADQEAALVQTVDALTGTRPRADDGVLVWDFLPAGG